MITALAIFVVKERGRHRPMSCAGAAQYNRKVCHGIEISLMNRFEAWRIDHEKQTGCCEPSEEAPF